MHSALAHKGVPLCADLGPHVEDAGGIAMTQAAANTFFGKCSSVQRTSSSPWKLIRQRNKREGFSFTVTIVYKNCVCACVCFLIQRVHAVLCVSAAFLLNKLTGGFHITSDHANSLLGQKPSRKRWCFRQWLQGPAARDAAGPTVHFYPAGPGCLSTGQGVGGGQCPLPYLEPGE